MAVRQALNTSIRWETHTLALVMATEIWKLSGHWLDKRCVWGGYDTPIPTAEVDILDSWPANTGRKHPDANSIRTAWGRLDSRSSALWGVYGETRTLWSSNSPQAFLLLLQHLSAPPLSLCPSLMDLCPQIEPTKTTDCGFFMSSVTKKLKCSGIWNINFPRLYLKSLSWLLRALGRQ